MTFVNTRFSNLRPFPLVPSLAKRDRATIVLQKKSFQTAEERETISPLAALSASKNLQILKLLLKILYSRSLSSCV